MGRNKRASSARLKSPTCGRRCRNSHENADDGDQRPALPNMTLARNSECAALSMLQRHPLSAFKIGTPFKRTLARVSSHLPTGSLEGTSISIDAPRRVAAVTRTAKSRRAGEVLFKSVRQHSFPATRYPRSAPFVSITRRYHANESFFDRLNVPLPQSSAST